MARQFCRVCGALGPRKKCPCELVFYCGRACQQRDWVEHRLLCSRVGGGVPDEAANPKAAEDFRTYLLRAEQYHALAATGMENAMRAQEATAVEAKQQELKKATAAMEAWRTATVPLPPWRPLADPATGKPFYWNAVTRETSWKLPPEARRRSKFALGAPCPPLVDAEEEEDTSVPGLDELLRSLDAEEQKAKAGEAPGDHEVVEISIATPPDEEAVSSRRASSAAAWLDCQELSDRLQKAQDTTADPQGAAQLPPGTRVIITGTTTRPELNGMCGEVAAFQESSQRYKVVMDDGTRFLFKFANLVAVPTGNDKKEPQAAAATTMRSPAVVPGLPTVAHQEGAAVAQPSSGPAAPTKSAKAGSLRGAATMPTVAVPSSSGIKVLGRTADPPGVLPAALTPGARIVLRGLQRSDANGTGGTVLRWDADTQRYEVKLDSGKSFRIKPENLVLEAAAVAATSSRTGTSSAGLPPQQHRRRISWWNGDQRLWTQRQRAEVAAEARRALNEAAARQKAEQERKEEEQLAARRAQQERSAASAKLEEAVALRERDRLREAIEEGRRCGLSDEDLREGVKALEEEEARHAARDALRKALASRKVEELRSAIRACEDAGARDGLEAARRIVSAEEGLEAARKALQEAIESRDQVALWNALGAGEEHGVPAEELEPARLALLEVAAAERRAQAQLALEHASTAVASGAHASLLALALQEGVDAGLPPQELDHYGQLLLAAEHQPPLAATVAAAAAARGAQPVKDGEQQLVAARRRLQEVMASWRQQQELRSAIAEGKAAGLSVEELNLARRLLAEA